MQRMLQARLDRVAAAEPLRAGSLGLVHRACGTPSCRCHHGGPQHAAYQLTFQEPGRSRSVYVPKELVPEVRQGLAAQRRLQQLLREIHQLTRARIRTPVRHRRLRNGRP